MIDREGEGPFPHPAELFQATEQAAPPPPLPLPPFPTGTPLTWEDAKAVYSWAEAVLGLWGEAAPVFIQNVLSDAVRNQDMKLFRGWSVIQTALLDFARVPSENDIVH